MRIVAFHRPTVQNARLVGATPFFPGDARRIEARGAGWDRLRWGWLLRRVLLLTITLLSLALGGASCGELPYFRFLGPEEGMQPAEGVTFKLRVPLGTTRASLQVRLDGQELNPADWQIVNTEVTGPLGPLGPGPHRLEAEMPLDFVVFTANARVTRSFEVAGGLSFDLNPSVEQVQITGAVSGLDVELHDASGALVDAGVTDYQGSLVFFAVPPGTGYRVVALSSPPEMSEPFDVVSVEDSTPPQEFYDAQVLEEGYGYVTTRDGTTLSVFITLPGPVEDGPYPTVVNLSGYDPSQPGVSLLPPDDPFYDLLTGLCNLNPEKDPLDILCNGPTHPTGLIAGLLGYATVGVNLRGTACSGGAYDFFDDLQVLDGYDVVEAVATQDWVLHNEVGIVGLSYPGITSLFVARTQPPSLSAIVPLSVLANAVTSTLAPGGIFNDGFALEWGQTVLDRADPFGHGWDAERAAAGDQICADNQLLHSQKVDIIAKARSDIFYPPELADPVAPELFADRILVPIFTTGSWQDEQTGGHFPAMWDDFTSSPIVRRQAFNGAHADGLGPHTLVEYKLFLDFYVAKQRLPLPIEVSGLAPLLFEQLFGGAVQLPLDRVEEFAAYPSFEEALAAYEAEDPVRIVFESGGTPGLEGAPRETFDARFTSWPPPEAEARRFWLHQDGSLRDFTPSEASSASLFRHDAAKGQETLVTLDGGPAPASFFWNAWQEGRQAVFVGEPLTEDLVVVGHASADLWLRGGVEEAELEVMLSEVRPDGQETYVQSGWLRASQRALAAESTELRPVQYHLEEDFLPVPTDRFELARVEIFPFAHVFRAGSRIRMSVASPGGNRARWRFDLTEYEGEVVHAVAHSAEHPSSLVLSVIPGITPPVALPPCALRAQPCRDYVPHVNTLE